MKYFSPGRINLIGEHIDYNGGHVLPCSIDLGITGHVEVRADKKIVLQSLNFPGIGELEFKIQKSYNKQNNWSDYVLGVIQILNDRGYINVHGFELQINSTIPIGSGLSSSASLEVLVAQIVSDINEFRLTKSEIAIIAKEAENKFVGVNCGIMDQFVIANGVENSSLFLDCTTLGFIKIPINLNSYSFVVLDTKKKRGLVESEYNDRRLMCERGLSIAQQFFQVDNLCDLDEEKLEELKGVLKGEMYLCMKHVITEELRVKQFVKVLETNQVQELGKILILSHRSLRDDFKVSCKELDLMVELALKNGALGARMTGAGFGGCAIALVENKKIENLIKKTESEYEKAMGIKGKVYQVKIVNGVSKIDE